MKISTFIPADAVRSFEMFANKVKRNVKGFDYTIGHPYKKVFHHGVINPDGTCDRFKKVFHEVCDVTIIEPEEKDWRLIATYKNNIFLPNDPTKEIVYKNPKHGEDYDKCDHCGHWCKNSYVIKNIKTGEELQVGCECVKKFGITSFDYLSRFNRELYSIYDYSINFSTTIPDEIPIWGGKKDLYF